LGVALSWDGGTALIGGQATAVFVRSGSTWTLQGSTLPGGSVALSADGNTALTGDPTYNGTGDFSQGAAWAFARSGRTWTQRGSMLTGGDGSFGDSVALSADGNTALVGSSGGGHPRSSGTAVVFTSAHELTVTKTGSGSGTVTSSLLGVSCGRRCSARYAVGTYVRLTAKPAAGSVFSGWSKGGCSGKRTCTVQLSSDRSVTAKFTLKPPKITKARIDRKHQAATFTFNAPGAKMLQCALITTAHGKKHPKPHFVRCRSLKAYEHLKAGKYTFEVRGFSHGSAGLAAKRRFSV
jgi:hypothetical protein